MADYHLVMGNKAYSSWSMRPWVALKANGIDFQETVICLQQPDTAAQIAKYSAAGKVPVFKHGAITVWESLAILDYFADNLPGYWWPEDCAARAMARSISAEMHAGFSHVRSVMSMNVRKDLSRRARTPEAEADVKRICALWNDARKAFGAGGPYLFGRFTNADAMYAPVVTRFKTYGVPLDAVSQAYCEAMLASAPLKQWYADAAAESWVIDKYELPNG